MKASEIKPKMILCHKTDVELPRQKLFVLMVETRLNTKETIYCEWMNKIGEKQKAWFDPELLENYY